MSQSAISLNLHPKQGEALQSEATEILYGGAAGGGKSHLIRVASIIWCTSIPGLQVYLFRRIEGDLIKNHLEGPKGFRELLAQWVNDGICQIISGEIKFWNGSKIYLCHCKDEKDRFKYLGAEMHVLLIDELTTFTETIYRFLRSRVRAVGLKSIPEQYKGKFPRIICGTNPGNIGHLWVKTAFVDGFEEMEIKRMHKTEGGMLRQYIPARLEDNPSMSEDDPEYENRLSGLGSEALVKAMRRGIWDIVEGAYFDCWSKDMVIDPFKIPDHWLKFRSFDWGSAKPFSAGWWAVASEAYIHNGKVIPVGSLVRYREWYGVKKDESGRSKPDIGLKLTAEEVAEGIKEREHETIDYGVADPSIFAEDGGPSICERMDWMFTEADNKRVASRGHIGGWDQMRDRMKGIDGRPMIYCFKTCFDSIRTIPALQHDDNRPEDVNTNMEDHAADEWRYACMSRPWNKPKPQPEEPGNDIWGRQRKEEDSWKTI